MTIADGAIGAVIIILVIWAWAQAEKTRQLEKKVKEHRRELVRLDKNQERRRAGSTERQPIPEETGSYLQG